MELFWTLESIEDRDNIYDHIEAEIGTRLLFAAAVLLFAMAVTAIVRVRTENGQLSTGSERG